MEGFLFNVNVKIINANLKFLIKLHKSDVPKQFQNLFKSALWCCFNIMLLNFFSTIFFFAFLFFYMKHIFLLSVLFTSYLSRHSATTRAFKDIQRALEHLRHSERTQGHLATQRALRVDSGTQPPGGHSGTWTFKGLLHSDILGTRALGHLEHVCTWALGHSRYSDTRAIGHTRHFI